MKEGRNEEWLEGGRKKPRGGRWRSGGRKAFRTRPSRNTYMKDESGGRKGTGFAGGRKGGMKASTTRPGEGYYEASEERKRERKARKEIRIETGRGHKDAEDRENDRTEKEGRGAISKTRLKRIE